MRNLIQLSFFVATVVVATASTAEAQSCQHDGKGAHGHGHGKGRGHGKAYGHGKAHGHAKHRDDRYREDREWAEFQAAVRDDREDLRRIVRMQRDWDRYSHAGDYRRLHAVETRLDLWLRHEIEESKRELREAERALQEARRRQREYESYAAVYHPHGEYRGYVRYPQNLQSRRRAVTQAREDLNRVKGLSAELRISRNSSGRRHQISLQAAVLDELVWISRRELKRGEAQVASFSGHAQYARY